MAKIEVSAEKSPGRSPQREAPYPESDDLGWDAQRLADSSWNAGRSMVADTCGLISQFVVAFGRALAPSGYYSQRRQGPGGDYYSQYRSGPDGESYTRQRRDSGGAVVETHSETKTP